MSTKMSAKDLLTTTSFEPGDVTLLLKQTEGSPVTVEEKERLVANGGHYSDVFVKENPLTASLKKAYQFALHENNGARRLAYHVQYLAQQLVDSREANEPIVLISLVRAGVPLGVLLKRYISRYFPQVPVAHYGISIIRDRGIDSRALETIYAQHPGALHYFVDGWTGKGSISTELRAALAKTPQSFDYRLIVSSDPARTATLCATHEDWLIPFGLVGAQISGLFSRTLWSDQDYHTAAYFDDLESDDIAPSFINAVEQYTALSIEPAEFPSDGPGLLNRQSSQTASDVVSNVVQSFDLRSVHKVKPGIAEATRAIHRRTPKVVILKNADSPETKYLLDLAVSKGVEVKIGLEGGMGPFKAITILE